MNTRYLNPWYKSNGASGPRFYETSAAPKNYRGYLIYHRINSAYPLSSGAHCFDIVKNGVCVSQMAGPRGATDKIDAIITASA